MNIRFLIILLCFASCMNSKKLAEQCKEKFPCEIGKSDTVTIVNERIETDTIKIEGQTVFVTDTVQCPPTVEPITIIRQVQAKCPESQVIEKVRFVETEKTITIEVLDSSQNYLNKLEIDKLKSVVQKSQRKLYFSLGGLSFMFLLLMIAIYFLIKKK